MKRRAGHRLIGRRGQGEALEGSGGDGRCGSLRTLLGKWPECGREGLGAERLEVAAGKQSMEGAS